MTFDRLRASTVIPWLLQRTVRRASRRFVLEAMAVAFPVAILGATLLFIDAAVQSMTANALGPVQVEMRAVAKSLDAGIGSVWARMAKVPGVELVEPFAAARVTVGSGSSGDVTARLFAVDPAYLAHHPWVKPMGGSLADGALLSQSLRAAPGFEKARTVTISLPGDAPPLSLTLPVAGTVDLRQASTWFSIPYGEVQGDVVTVPRALVIDYRTFEREVLPTLQAWARNGGLPPFDPGADELPWTSLEAHISVDHAAYPADPGQAAIWSGQLQHVLGRLAGSSAVVADNAVEVLTESKQDATNAKILFVLLGIPGVLVAGGLGLTAASALVESYRRDEALLRIRGATDGQLAQLVTAHAAAAGVVGSVLGLLTAVLAVSAIIGRPVWQGVPPEGLLLSLAAAVAAGAVACSVRVIALRQASRRSLLLERRLLHRDRSPLWRRAQLDLVAIIVAMAILAVNFMTGGLRRSPIEGPALALSFYVLLAPLALWLGATLLLIRGIVALLAVWARPGRAKPVSSWRGAVLRWLGRRSEHPARALAVGALAVAFATEVLVFSATYQAAKKDEARAAVGADLRITLADPRGSPPPLGPSIASIAPVRLVPARVDTDRKTILSIDLDSYEAAATSEPRILAGSGLEGLAEPGTALINYEIAESYELHPGDMVPITIFPDDHENAREIQLKVVGVYAAIAPTWPGAELVTTTSTLPRATTVPPDFYLARLAPGRDASAVAKSFRSNALRDTLVATNVVPAEERGLTALNLAGLSLLESCGAGIVAAGGVAILGAFLILERRRELAILYAVGADTRQVLTAPLIEGGLVAVGSLAIGLPIGLSLGALAVRVLGLFFLLPPETLALPIGGLILLAALMAGASALALGGALIAVIRVRAVTLLRDL